MIHYGKKELHKRMPNIDYFIDSKEIEKLPKILGLKKTTTRNSTLSHSAGSVLIPISYGCNNFCSYCIVPFARGKEVSIPVNKILKDVRKAVSEGAKEIWLLGQTVNSYKWKVKKTKAITEKSLPLKRSDEKSGVLKSDCEINFATLLRLINAIPGDFWIRFTSPHPKSFNNDLIKAMAECEKVTRYLHLPVQSGNNEILKKMRRLYTVEHYKKIIAKVRKAIPGIAISTDIIVGFPNETKKQFQDTVQLFKEVKFDMAYISEYSPRSKTLADKIYKDKIPHSEKGWRKKYLNDEVLAKTALNHNKILKGKTLKCFADKIGNIRTEGNKLVILEINHIKRSLLDPAYNSLYSNTSIEKQKDKKSGALKNDYPIDAFFNIKITKAEPWKLRGEVVK